jgi:hypothetical protein
MRNLGPLQRAAFVRYVTPGLESTFNAELSSTGDLISKTTGQPITDGEMGQYPVEFQAIIAAVTDDEQRFEDIAAEGDDRDLKDYKKDPVKYWNRRKDTILAGIGQAQAKGIPTTVLEKGLSDVEGQITAHTKAQAEKAKEIRTQEGALARIKETGKQARLTKGVSAKPKEGDTRQFRRGTKTITQEYRGGKWTKLAEGEAFSPKEGKTAYEKDEAKLMDDYRSLASLEKSIQMKGLDDPMVQMALALNPSLAEGMEAKDVSEVLKEALCCTQPDRRINATEEIHSRIRHYTRRRVSWGFRVFTPRDSRL